MRGRIRTLLRTAVLGLAIVAVVPLAAQPAHAVYYYRPGDVMNGGGPSQTPNRCTGGWGVRGIVWNEPYLMTAGHCFVTGERVFGTDGEIGVTAYSLWISQTAGYDTALVRPTNGTDGRQELPFVGARVVGTHNSFLAGQPIAMFGQISRLQYGTVIATTQWGNATAVCATYRRARGDSGGPVFTHDGRGRAWAAGMHVMGGEYVEPGTGRRIPVGCFLTVSDILARLGDVYLPVFPSLSGPAHRLRAADATPSFGDLPMAELSGLQLD